MAVPEKINTKEFKLINDSVIRRIKDLTGSRVPVGRDPSPLRGAIRGSFHLAGGDRIHDFYMDSHSGATPEPAWEWAEAFAPRFPNLRAITYEFRTSFPPTSPPPSEPPW